MITYDKLFIGGQWVAPSSTAVYQLNSASTEELIGSVPQASEADIDRAVAAAREALNDPSGWANWEPSRRADAIDQLAHQLEIRAEEIARRVSSQNGMPISIATELEGKLAPGRTPLLRKPSAQELFRERTTALDGRHHPHAREPLGVVAAIAPWKLPPDACDVQACSCAGRRLQRRSETVTGNLVGLVPVRRSGRRHRHTTRCDQHPARRPRRGSPSRRTPWRR